MAYQVLLALVNGIVAGLILAIFVGPVFFVLLQTAMRKGFKQAVYFSAGIITSDMLYFIMAYFGISAFGPKLNLKLIMPIAGGLFILIYGITLMFKDYHIHKADAVVTVSHWKTYVKGFLVNTISPSGLIYWIGVVSTLHATYDQPNEKIFIFIFFLSCMATVFGTDMLKAHYANKLGKIITDKVLYYINRVGGILLMSVGAYYVSRFIVYPYLLKPYFNI